MRYPTGNEKLDLALYGGIPGGNIMVLDLTPVSRKALEKQVECVQIDSGTAASELCNAVAHDPTGVYYCQHDHHMNPDTQMKVAKVWGDINHLAARLHRKGGALIFLERPRYNSILWASRVHVYETMPDRFTVTKGLHLVLSLMEGEAGNLTPHQRWDAGLPHDPRSHEVFEMLRDADLDLYFDWQSGGDGDNGEHLMFQLDSWYARKDRIAQPDPSDGSG